MFRLTRTLLLFQMFFTTLQGADVCITCPDNQNALAALKLNDEILLDLVKDLQAKLKESLEWPTSKNALCPSGFTYLPSAGSCYKVVYEKHDWTSAGNKCQQLQKGSHLAAITSAEENEALKTFLKSELSKNEGNTVCILDESPEYKERFWTSGQRLIQNNCQSPFVWKPSRWETLPFVFTSWSRGQPDCWLTGESCMHFWTLDNFAWNDMECTRKVCPLCEYKP